jgi:hypothetical protein
VDEGSDSGFSIPTGASPMPMLSTAISRYADGVPTWSPVAVFARPDGRFTIVY